jgi:hypothetical protein
VTLPVTGCVRLVTPPRVLEWMIVARGDIVNTEYHHRDIGRVATSSWTGDTDQLDMVVSVALSADERVIHIETESNQGSSSVAVLTARQARQLSRVLLEAIMEIYGADRGARGP